MYKKHYEIFEKNFIEHTLFSFAKQNMLFTSEVQMPNNILDLNTKIKNIIKVINDNQSLSEQAIANLLAFSVWSEKMPSAENLTQILTYINLFYSSGEYIFDDSKINVGINASLFTNNLYIELLNNLINLSDNNSKLAVMCIVTAKTIKKSPTKIADKYLKIFDDDKMLKTIYTFFTK